METERSLRFEKAYDAMGVLGISPKAVKPVLGWLLKLYKGNWEHIEEDNYRTLADAIFEHADDKESAEKRNEAAHENAEPALKKQKQELSKNEALSSQEKDRNVEDASEGRVPKPPSGTTMAASTKVPTQGRTRRFTSVQTGSKYKNTIQKKLAPDDRQSLPRPPSGGLHTNRETRNQEPNNPGLVPKLNREPIDNEDKRTVLRENQPSACPPMHIQPERNVENSKEGRIPKTSSGKRMVESSLVSRDQAREPHRRASHVQTRSKQKDPAQTNSAPDEQKSSPRPLSSAGRTGREPNNPGLAPKIKRTAVDDEDTIVLREKQLRIQSERNVENSKEGGVPKASRGTRTVEPSSVSRDPAREPHRRLSHVQNGSKNKDLVQTASAADEKKSFHRSSSSALRANSEPIDSGLVPKMKRKTVDDEATKSIVQKKKQLSDYPAPQIQLEKNVEDSREGRVPKTSSGKTMVDSSSVSKDLARETHRRFSHVQSGSKHRDHSQTNTARDEEKSFPSPSSIATHNRESNDPRLGPKMKRKAVDNEDTSTKTLRKRQPSDNPDPNIQPGSINSVQQLGVHNKENGSVLGHNSQTTFDIASSANGHVKVSLTCINAQQHNTPFLRTDEVLRFAEVHSQRFYVNLGAQFSLVNFLNGLCDGVLDNINERSPMRISPRDYTNQSSGSRENAGKDHPECRELSSESLDSSRERHLGQSKKKQTFHKMRDITKGSEKVKISLLDEVGTEPLPRFAYCPVNVPYESAFVHVSLARISNEDYCRRCKGNCVLNSIPCACARDTGGEYAYTSEGLLTEKFLESCITMKIEPRDEDLFYCQECPLERAKNDSSTEKCKGHLLRKFIKECWVKCSCNMQCGNRVVQRGISRRLEVFLYEGKGWGLRTLEELPKGAFVCEYVGEILTNTELFERNKKNAGNGKHVYPVLLDADWGTEGVLKDEEALCLDATYYGNVARFINHRCFDGNIIDIPVQVETPDRHCYHIAFFTNRKVEALEELTWDYGIDFDDESHPIKAFRCRCGSPFCRDTNRQS
ncbi:probable inactive histone-lysine N-methyltransferase SUVR1 [Andrographis paniculata]|uniref:probable inactive histone-lysine N-methyltransferase SUVR1 n=1 Tax=Andrographis paniculata TaxID=175694 RepID=UPI0021E93FE9|nr:probable inactive histone-lysine N-methyltransferase SUVR1 [Andrographis paniculata]